MKRVFGLIVVVISIFLFSTIVRAEECIYEYAYTVQEVDGGESNKDTVHYAKFRLTINESTGSKKVKLVEWDKRSSVRRWNFSIV